MTLAALYDQAIARGDIQNDPLQREILVPMQRLADTLYQNSQSSWFSWLAKKSIKGLYIYGSVGVGKTYLVNLFYDSLEEPKKARYHFHHFMQQIDAQLRILQGTKDPLRVIAKNMAESVRVLCFDEFLVNDVAYAMILAELLQALIASGVVLVISSNTKPDDLYLKGVQRARFLPAIALLKAQCEVLELDEPKDYRLGREPKLQAYLWPLNVQTQQAMEVQFLALVKEPEGAGNILVQNRTIPYVNKGGKTVWFSFDVLCNLPRSQLDYIEIAEHFECIFLSEVPCLTENHTAQTILLVYFIDLMYDKRIQVIISAAVPLDELYVKGEMKVIFQRTLSRLQEMQSLDYLRPYRPMV